MENYSNINLLKFKVSENGYEFDSEIIAALGNAKSELAEVVTELNDNLDKIQKLTPACDKTDYVLATSCGVLCGILDVFGVSEPKKTPLGKVTNRWFEKCTIAFARLSGWKGQADEGYSAAISYLEKKYQIPYDQRGAGDAASKIFDLNPRNHHFKSLAHNPTLLGLFFSIIDQFSNTSHFVTNGQVIALQEASNTFQLQGYDIPSKLFAGFVNWLGHLFSDVSGASNSKTRGMGIPSTFWSWTNSVVLIKSELNLNITEFDNLINQVALEIYLQGYDARFQLTQAIPVVINELLVRFIYSTRRILSYFKETIGKQRSFSSLWSACEPFSNATVKRMLTVAHGTFCLVDIGDALVAVTRGNVIKTVLRLNVIGVGRFMVSLSGEAKRKGNSYLLNEQQATLKRQESLLQSYILGLKELAEIYDDKSLLDFTEELKNSKLYVQAFEKSVQLARKRAVPKNEILKNKTEIDNYFLGR